MGVLRFLLACSVVVAHSRQFFGFYGMGGNAVPAFFMVSGFYMQMIISNKYQGPGGRYLFYTNRALRLFPMYWAVLILWVLAAQLPFEGWPWLHISSAAGNPLRNATDGSFASLVAAIPNLTFLGADVIRLFIVAPDGSFHLWNYGVQESDGWLGAYHWIINPPIWSLGVEIVFYAFVPFLVRLSTKRLIFVTGMLLGVHLFIWSLETMGWRHLISPYCGVYFLMGMLAWRIPLPDMRPVVAGAAAFPFLIWAFWQYLPSPGGLSGRILELAIFTLFAYCLRSLFEISKNWKLDARLGAYSYPMYLVHMLFGWPMTQLDNWAGPAAIALSVAVSWLLLQLVDKPIESWRQSRVRIQRAL